MKVEKHLSTIHDTEPTKFKLKNLGGKLYELTLNENIQPITIENENGVESKFKSDLTIGIGKFENKNQIKGAFVRLKYSIDEEFAFNYKEKEDPDFIAYRNHVNEAKNFVDQND